MNNANPDALALRDGFNVLQTLPGLPTFSVDTENTQVLFVLRNWKTPYPEVLIYSKVLDAPRIVIGVDSLSFPSARELACFRPVFKDWVNRMIQVSSDNDAKLLEHVEQGAPPGWAVPNTEQPPRRQSFGSIAQDRANWEQAQARKNNDL